MAPVSRAVHLIGMSVFGLLHALLRTLLILGCSVPFFALNFSHADWVAAAVVIAVGSISLIGLGILTGILPMLYPERGEQMSFMVQAVVLLVSGVYYGVDVLPGWLHAASSASPATYLLRGIRHAVLDGAGLRAEAGTIGVLAVFGA